MQWPAVAGTVAALALAGRIPCCCMAAAAATPARQPVRRCRVHVQAQLVQGRQRLCMPAQRQPAAACEGHLHALKPASSAQQHTAPVMAGGSLRGHGADRWHVISQGHSRGRPTWPGASAWARWPARQEGATLCACCLAAGSFHLQTETCTLKASPAHAAGLAVHDFHLRCLLAVRSFGDGYLCWLHPSTPQACGKQHPAHADEAVTRPQQ